MRTEIHNLKIPAGEKGNICYRQYIMFDKDGKKCATAKPKYAQDDNPAITGWPVNRMPKIDHAQRSVRRMAH